MKRYSCTTLMLAAMISLPSSAVADQADDAIKARQAFYRVVQFNYGALFAISKGDVAYDARSALTYARNLEILSKMDTKAMWLPNTSTLDKPGKTRALPEIWSKFPAITEKSKTWRAASSDLADVADDGLKALRSKIGALGASCKGCHTDYRAKSF